MGKELELRRRAERLPPPGAGPRTGGRVQVRRAAGPGPRDGRAGHARLRSSSCRPRSADRTGCWSPGCRLIAPLSASAATTRRSCLPAALGRSSGRSTARPLVRKTRPPDIRRVWEGRAAEQPARRFRLGRGGGLVRGCRRSPTRVVLVDDVYTTGATARRCPSSLGRVSDYRCTCSRSRGRSSGSTTERHD